MATYDFAAFILSFFWCGSEVGQSSFRRSERSTTKPKPAGMYIRFDADFPRFLHPFPGKQNAPKSYKKALISKKSRLFWWGRVDSNHRRHSQQIYSLSPLATREHPRVVASFGSFASAQARKLIPYAAPPFQIEPATLGFDLITDSVVTNRLRRFVELVDGLEPPTC